MPVSQEPRPYTNPAASNAVVNYVHEVLSDMRKHEWSGTASSLAAIKALAASLDNFLGTVITESGYINKPYCRIEEVTSAGSDDAPTT